MNKYDAVAPLPQRPDRTHRHVDLLLPGFGVVLGLSLAALVWATELAGIARTPALFGGWLVGVLVPRLYRHRFRVLGVVPIAATAGAVTATLATLLDGWEAWTIALFSLCEGTALGAILRYRDRVKVGRVGFNLSALLALILAGLCLWLFEAVGGRSDGWRAGMLTALPVAAAVLAGAAFLILMRPLVEVVVELIARVMYKADAAGPGLGAVPTHGPLLVIANHAAWFDPLFVAEVVPRPTTPMMTAGFYDLPGLRFLMRRVFRVIRVTEKATRRDAPEVRQAIDALGHGRCVVIFPEGYLRRKEEQVLRRFGRGVWQILAACPETPVVACWVEGSWGSYFSHYNGPPTKNKPRDVRRPIRIGVSEALRVPPELLKDHMATRIFLMNLVLMARRHLALPEVPPVELPVGEVEDE